MKKRRLLSLLLTICMVSSLVPTLAYALEPSAETADFTADDNGVAALELLNAAKTGSDESTWDSATKTLTLKGVNFTTSALRAVKLPGGSTIVLEDENTIASGRTEAVQSSSYGIYAEGDLTIQGTGTLTVKGGNAYYSYGIYAYDGVTIQGGTVTATGGTAVYDSYGIYADAVTISGGIVNAYGGEAVNSCGIFAFKSNVTITGGTVEAKGGAADYESYGIYAGTNVEISGGSVEATGGTATGYNGESYGIHANKDVTIESGTVTATGGKASEYSHGISTGSNVTIKAGTVTAEAGEAGIESYGIEAYTGSITIAGGHVTAHTLDEAGALNKAPTLPATYYWRLSNSGDYEQYPDSAYTWDAANTYAEITDTLTYTITLNAGDGTVATTGMTTGTDGKLTEALPTPHP